MTSIFTKLFCRAALVASCLISLSANAALINEFEPNPAGSDPAHSTFELYGTAGESFTGWLLSIESDGTSSAGTVDRSYAVSGIFDVNGLLQFSGTDLENPSFTLLLTSEFTGSSVDVDANNDGIVDIDVAGTFGTIFDSISVTDSETDPVYAAQFGGTDFTYTGDEPKLMFRDGLTQEWFALNDDGAPQTQVYKADGSVVDAGMFNQDPNQSTYGAVNPHLPQATAVNEPATLVMFALVAMFSLVRRSRIS